MNNNNNALTAAINHIYYPVPTVYPMPCHICSKVDQIMEPFPRFRFKLECKVERYSINRWMQQDRPLFPALDWIGNPSRGLLIWGIWVKIKIVSNCKWEKSTLTSDHTTPKSGPLRWPCDKVFVPDQLTKWQLGPNNPLNSKLKIWRRRAQELKIKSSRSGEL